MYLLAPTTLRVALNELPSRVSARFAGELRRAGSFAQLSLLGAQACLDIAGDEGPLGVLYSSRIGAQRAVRAALGDDLRRGEPAMPFTFIGMQPHLAGALLAQRSLPVVRCAHLHLAADAWPWLLRVAQGWLADCSRVLVGCVEESDDDGIAHRTDWCLLQDGAGAGSIRFEPAGDESATAAASMADWIPRICSWHAAPLAPLALRGAGETWRFSVAE